VDGQVKADAQEFGRHVKQGGWRLGLLVARNVEKDNGHGGRKRNDRKVSAARFAQMSGTSAPRVLRYFDAWEKAADQRVVAHAVELVPGQEVRGLDVEKLPSWEDFFDASKSGGRPRDSKPEDAVKILSNPEKRTEAVKQMTPSEKVALANEILETDPAALARAAGPGEGSIKFGANLGRAHSHVEAQREERKDERERIQYQRTADEQVLERVKRELSGGHYGEAERQLDRLEDPTIAIPAMEAQREKLTGLLDWVNAWLQAHRGLDDDELARNVEEWSNE
jgi:hypothetical protein